MSSGTSAPPFTLIATVRLSVTSETWQMRLEIHVARSRADAGADLFEQEIVRVTKAAVAAGREVREHAVDLVDRRA